MADPAIIFKPSLSVLHQGTLKVEGVTTNYTLYFGDGFAHAGRPDQSHSYTWPSPGPYTAVLVRDGEREPFTKTSFRILPQPQPNVTVEQVPDAEYTVRVAFTDPDEGPVGRFSITWAPGESAIDVLGIPGTSIDHYFGEPGRHPILIQDHWSMMRRPFVVEIVDPVVDPDVTLVEDTSDTTRMTVKLDVANASGSDRKLLVDWDDGVSEQIDATVGVSVSHQYVFAGEYMVSVRYTDDHDAWRAVWVTVPFTGGAA
jgi:hypothetical protein